MIVLSGVNFTYKENMYRETKYTFIKFLGTFTVENDRIGHDVKLEPAWRKLTSSSYKAGHIQRSDRGGGGGGMKKKINHLRSDGKILLCYSCGSYRHLVAECQDSWENMAKKKAIECNVKMRNNSNEDKLEDDETRGIEPLEHGETCGVPVANKQLAGEMTQLQVEIRNLKAEIQEIKAVKDKELIRQKEEILRREKILEENELQQKEGGTILQELFQSIMELQGELSKAIKEIKDKLTTKDSLSQNNQCDCETKEKEIEIWRHMEQEDRIKLLGTDDYAQVSKKETRTEGSSSEGIHQDNGTKQRQNQKTRQKLQMTQGRTKTVSLMSKGQLKQGLDTDRTSQIRQWQLRTEQSTKCLYHISYGG